MAEHVQHIIQAYREELLQNPTYKQPVTSVLNQWNFLTQKFQRLQLRSLLTSLAPPISTENDFHRTTIERRSEKAIDLHFGAIVSLVLGQSTGRPLKNLGDFQNLGREMQSPFSDGEEFVTFLGALSKIPIQVLALPLPFIMAFIVQGVIIKKRNLKYTDDAKDDANLALENAMCIIKESFPQDEFIDDCITLFRMWDNLFPAVIVFDFEAMIKVEKGWNSEIDINNLKMSDDGSLLVYEVFADWVPIVRKIFEGKLPTSSRQFSLKDFSVGNVFCYLSNV